MKKYMLILLVSTYCAPGQAQLLDRVRNRMEQKVVDKIDESIDKATQKKKPKNETAKEKTAENEKVVTETPASTSPESTAPAGTQAAPATTAAPVRDINSYSRFDFIAGEKVIVHEDFSRDALGDFPSNWNTRSGAELVTIVNREGKWLRMGQSGIFYPEYIHDNLPENFTLQLELLANQHVAGIGQWTVSLLQTKDTDEKFRWGEVGQIGDAANFKLTLQPASSKGSMYYSTNLIGSQSKSNVAEFNMPDKPSVKISIWRQKQRVRVYFDSTKVLDLPRALDANAVMNTLVFSSSNPEYDHKEGAFFMGDIRLAVGAPNLRNKLLTEGKFSTNGILFDVNSDRIKPESFGSLQDIAQLLKENTSLRIQIVGHTDADGDDHANQDLSVRRAASVKETLTTTFGIDASRMQSSGKGKSQPIDTNDTPAGKANNRRVEFIKL
ncbi:OmpA family protein [Dyadobacter sediminis]|nr:OmpA family protein [Dyadobacter sediminis]GGB97191.1 hypothetical protein GCM10011325_25650 [Dyadobacter sediminis]